MGEMSESAHGHVLERFLRYARVATPSNPDNDQVVPSNPEEHDLARMLEAELRELGVADARADGHAYVLAHIPASPGAQGAPCLGLIAHIDTSPDAPAHDVRPRIVRYEGGALVLGEHDGTSVALDEANTPGLARYAGQDLVCTDGSTLLGADDKAGVAEIMSLVERIAHDPALPHPRIAIAFAPDEEIGHGCALLDLDGFGASYAFTVDGGDLGEISFETFNAARAEVRFSGHEIHPGSAKGIMVNALHLLEEFDAMLPAWERPEHTDGYEGFFHLHAASGTTTAATALYIIRDHDKDRFVRRKQLMRDAAALMNERLDAPRVTVEIRDEYANMADVILDDHLDLIDKAQRAFEDAGVRPFVIPTRGGTDGAQLSFRGLPCPNLSAGGVNFHSVREFVPVRSLEKMSDVLVALAGVFAQQE